MKSILYSGSVMLVAVGITRMGANNGDSPREYRLTDEHRMLLRMRDMLYEGSWEDFIRDLDARAHHEPHVFDTIPETPGLKATIHHHLDLIADMQLWERESRQALRAD